MDISLTEYKRCDVVTVSGRVDSSTAPKLEEALGSITEAGRYKIVIEMTDTNFVSSKGWWTLIETQKKCKRYRRGEVILVNVLPEIRSSLDMVGMGSYFQIFDDLTAAVASF
ncbi:MAG TPA: STAS domain-containing protein [Anaerolineales bacterium]|nr:STAS domain-containing protein [Anaerolineales bacterium]